jgi:hypothetical protein
MKAIRTRYLPATSTKGSRIVASDCDGNRVIIGCPHELSGDAVHQAAADALCAKMSWTGKMVQGSLGACHVFVFGEEV